MTEPSRLCAARSDRSPSVRGSAAKLPTFRLNLAPHLLYAAGDTGLLAAQRRTDFFGHCSGGLSGKGFDPPDEAAERDREDLTIRGFDSINERG
ncbi:MAG: hypothetical protein WD489_10680 [Rhodovibrionaceae bacterium]